MMPRGVLAPGDFVGGEGARRRDIGKRGQVQRELLKPIDVLAFAIGFDDRQRIATVERLAIEMQPRKIDILEAAINKLNVNGSHALARDRNGDIVAYRVAADSPARAGSG